MCSRIKQQRSTSTCIKIIKLKTIGAADRAPWGSAWAAQAAQRSPQMVERDRKTLRMARLGGFAISTAFLDGPALGATA